MTILPVSLRATTEAGWANPVSAKSTESRKAVA